MHLEGRVWGKFASSSLPLLALRERARVALKKSPSGPSVAPLGLPGYSRLVARPYRGRNRVSPAACLTHAWLTCH